jgi:hypothetical protein
MSDKDLMAAWMAEPLQSPKSAAVIEAMNRMRFNANTEVVWLHYDAGQDRRSRHPSLHRSGVAGGGMLRGARQSRRCRLVVQ